MKRVLVVDDDQRTRRVLQIALKRLDLEPVGVATAELALQQLRREKVDLILTDLKMPGMDGIQFMRELRTMDEDVPVIVLTAYGTVESAVDAMKLGALDYIAKPVDIDRLVSIILAQVEA